MRYFVFGALKTKMFWSQVSGHARRGLPVEMEHSVVEVADPATNTFDAVHTVIIFAMPVTCTKDMVGRHVNDVTVGALLEF